MRRNDEIDINNNNNIEGGVLKSSSGRSKSSLADGKIGATLGIASGISIVMGVRALLLTLRAIFTRAVEFYSPSVHLPGQIYYVATPSSSL